MSRRRRRLLPTRAGRLLWHPGWLLSVILLAPGYSAQPATPGPSLSVQPVFQGLYCGRKGARVQWLDDRSAVVRVLARVRHNRARTSRVLRRLDFARQGVVVIRMGARPAASPAIVLAQTKANVIDDVLRIRVSWSKPPPGRKMTRVAISPCLLVAVPRGGYVAVTVVDAGGVVYGCTEVVPEGRTAACDDSAAGSVTEHTAAKLRHRQQ